MSSRKNFIIELERIFARKDTRKLSKELTFQHQGILYMIETKTPNRLRHATVTILWREKGRIEVEYNGMKLKYKKWSEKIEERPEILDSKELEARAMIWINKKTTRPKRRASLSAPIQYHARRF